jgi:hypothetical protein
MKKIIIAETCAMPFEFNNDELIIARNNNA